MGSIAPEFLYPRRLAHRALGMVFAQLGLEHRVIRLNPDDPSQALPGAAPGEISFYEDFAGGAGAVIATVLLEDSGRARVLVGRVERLIRRNHRKEFRAAEFGIVHHRGAPDIDAEVDLSEVVEVEGPQMRIARQRPLVPASSRVRPPRVIRSFGGVG